MTVKRTQLVMLPTNKKAIIQKFGNQLRLNQFKAENLAYWMNLYFLSDEQIKEGDWVLYYENKISQVLRINIDELKLDRGGIWRSSCKKIIATTDSSLIIEGECKIRSGRLVEYYPTESKLPQPSQDFIKVFVEEYNKGNVIEWVEVEYEIDQKIGEVTFIGGEDRVVEKIWELKANNKWYFDTNKGLDTWSCTYNKLKVNSKNEITIRKIKDNFTREEVRNIARAMYQMGRDELKQSQNEGRYIDTFDKWISKNL